MKFPSRFSRGSKKSSGSVTMQKHGTKTILAVMSDLFFSVKISDAANRVGIIVVF